MTGPRRDTQVTVTDAAAPQIPTAGTIHYIVHNTRLVAPTGAPKAVGWSVGSSLQLRHSGSSRPPPPFPTPSQPFSFSFPFSIFFPTGQTSPVIGPLDQLALPPSVWPPRPKPGPQRLSSSSLFPDWQACRQFSLAWLASAHHYEEMWGSVLPMVHTMNTLAF